MYQKGRLDDIVDLLKKYGYVTVKFLVSELHYSNATINRDLNLLEAQKVVRRTYGGVELVEKRPTVLPFRYSLMKAEKLKICKQVAELIKDGDTVFIDASTTTEYIARHLTEKKDITVITNNIAIVTHLSAYDIKVICLGGQIVEQPCMLGGEQAVESAMKYRADKAFFATGSFYKEGKIGSSRLYYLLQKVMVENSKESYYLADHEKLRTVANAQELIMMDFGGVSGVISDYEFDKQTQAKFPNTKFYKV